MPTYEYACKACDHAFEIVQSFSEDSLTTCPECGQDRLRKVYNAAGIIFKGDGWHIKDYAGGGPAAGRKADGGTTSDDGGGTSDDSAGTSGDGGTAAPAATDGTKADKQSGGTSGSATARPAAG